MNSKFTFFKAFTLLQEATPPGPAGDVGGGMGPGGDPMGGPPSGGMPPMGGPMGGGMGGAPGDPMGGGAAAGQPIEVKSLPAADVWKLLEKIVKDEKYDKFFEEINIAKKQQATTFSKKKLEKKSSLMR